MSSSQRPLTVEMVVTAAGELGWQVTMPPELRVLLAATFGLALGMDAPDPHRPACDDVDVAATVAEHGTGLADEALAAAFQLLRDSEPSAGNVQLVLNQTHLDALVQACNVARLRIRNAVDDETARAVVEYQACSYVMDELATAALGPVDGLEGLDEVE